MHFHLPKPLHGWREFAGEVAIIVLGVLIALGAEQLVQAVHRQAQARELSHKLYDQSADNRHVVIYDINTLQDNMNALDSDIAQLSPGGDPRALKQLARVSLFAMSDSTWVAARNSDLIDTLPSREVGNYEKLSITTDFLEARYGKVGDDVERAQAGIATEMLRRGDAPMSASYC
jgi:hypothetical protein